jgi:hypothetical protein
VGQLDQSLSCAFSSLDMAIDSTKDSVLRTAIDLKNAVRTPVLYGRVYVIDP